MTHLIGYTRDKTPVYVDLIRSDAARRISQQPNLLTLAAEVIQHLGSKGPNAGFEYDLGRPIGYDYVIEEDDEEAVFYARTVSDAAYTRFTKKGTPAATSYLAMVISREDDQLSYIVHDIWVGRLRPPRPGSGHETKGSDTYWRQHAVVFENQSIQSRSVTKICPYITA